MRFWLCDHRRIFFRGVKIPTESLPSDLAAAHAMILAERAARVQAEAVAANAQAVLSSSEALIGHLRLEIEKLRRELYGNRSERKARLLEQMELQLEDLEAPRLRTNWQRRRRRLRQNRCSSVGAPRANPFPRPSTA